jgi:glucose-1-phosphate cytidylyltransferase
MKVVLFCGGFGTRIREYSESVPKPMIPIGHHPILWHIMWYYSHYGHRDFILCLGYQANIIKQYFLDLKPEIYSDCVISDNGRHIEILGNDRPDWRVTLVDTGLQRNIGERLLAVKHLVQDEEIFLANYSDGLTDAPLAKIIENFKKSNKIGCFVAVRPSFNFHLAEFDADGLVSRLLPSQDTDMWINGGYFIFRHEIFNYIRDGDELVLAPFERLIKERRLISYPHTGFWRAMDTLNDKRILEEMVARGEMPWHKFPERTGTSAPLSANGTP